MKKNSKRKTAKRAPSKELTQAQIQKGVSQFAKRHKLDTRAAQNKLLTLSLSRHGVGGTLDRDRAKSGKKSKPKVARKTAKSAAGKVVKRPLAKAKPRKPAKAKQPSVAKAEG